MNDCEIRLRAMKMALDFLAPAELAIEDVLAFADGIYEWLTGAGAANEPAEVEF